MFMLVVDARETGLGRLLIVETEVLDRVLDGPATIVKPLGPSCDFDIQACQNLAGIAPSTKHSIVTCRVSPVTVSPTLCLNFRSPYDGGGIEWSLTQFENPLE